MVNKPFLTILIVALLGATIHAQCVSGSPFNKLVSCCNAGNVSARVCQGSTGQCDPFTSEISCTSVCHLEVAGECSSASAIPKLKPRLDDKLASSSEISGCSVERPAFQDWLQKTSSQQLSFAELVR
jgi:hypothetical protein